eukprot:5730-Heterococcus_DN1.PRE.6
MVVQAYILLLYNTCLLRTEHVSSDTSQQSVVIKAQHTAVRGTVMHTAHGQLQVYTMLYCLQQCGDCCMHTSSTDLIAAASTTTTATCKA